MAPYGDFCAGFFTEKGWVMWGINQRDFYSRCPAFLAFLAGQGRHKIISLTSIVLLREELLL